MDRPLDDRKGRAHNRNLALRADFHDINWHHYTHPQLYNMVWSANPEHISGQADGWRSIAAKIEETTGDVRHTLSNLFASWQGAAADSARASNDRLTRWAEQMTERTVKIANGLTDYVEALHAARQAMPPPEFAWAENAADHGDPFKIVSGPAQEIELNQLLDDQRPNFEKHHAAWQEAVRVMSAYAHNSQTMHDALPEHYEPAPSTGESGPGTPPAWPYNDPKPVPLPRPWPPKPGVPGDIDGDGVPDGTTPGSYTPAVAAAGPEAGYGTATGPGGSGGAEAPRALGGMAGANPLAVRGSGASAMPAARGAGGANSFAPLGTGAGAKREEDQEHQTKYVEGMDWLDELPPAYPPVFGA
jgi:hypothetical protein